MNGPLIVGTLVIIGLAAYVTVADPAPGQLGRSHAALEGVEKLSGCNVCHAPGGLTEGCLGCHEEIRSSEYHRTRVGACEECHSEHHGAGFDVRWKGRDPATFQHAHVLFTLWGGHAELACDQCHTDESTYLGATQECVDCHGDVHDGYTRCEGCHDQNVFEPAVRFDHARVFPLDGGHAGVACNGCHVSFEAARGTRCAECHLDPHRMPGTEACGSCHEGPEWTDATLTVAQHDRTGFRLDETHARVACEKCHGPEQPRVERRAEDCAACHQDPHDGQFAGQACRACHDDTFKVPTHEHETFALRHAHAQAACDACHKQGEYEETPSHCAGCHEDTHEGQFGDAACNACHTDAAFKPAVHDHKSFPLRAAHAEAECAACHREGRFVGTPRRCQECHEDPHRGQFKDCEACHSEQRWLPPRYDVATHRRFPLTGAHRAVACNACHKDGQFVGLSQRCADCHEDPHGTQFEDNCAACHNNDSFRVRPYEHKNYALTGAHAEATCNACHRRENGVRRYRDISTACASCHTDPHRGQFKHTTCDECHGSRKTWAELSFDHNRQTRFPLDRAHAQVACDRCHIGVKQPDDTFVVQYRPLGTQCRDCHDFDKR